MISRVRGTLVRRDLSSIEVATQGGVTYELLVPLTVFERLPREGGEVELRTYHVVREDSQELFGFIDASERVLFGKLLSASGVGPRLALNMLSTIAMVRMGKVIGNLMVDLNPSNIKLRDRAVRILQELTDCSGETAHAALESSGWVVKDAWLSLKKKKR